MVGGHSDEVLSSVSWRFGSLVDRKPEGSAENRRYSIDQVVGTDDLDRKRARQQG